MSEISNVSAADNFGDASSRGVFQMSIAAKDWMHGGLETSIAAEGWSPSAFEMSVPPAVPELPAWGLLVIGFGGLQLAHCLRRLPAHGRATI